MLDKDLASLYRVTTANLNKAVNRNLDRFPDDFMFQLTREEFINLKFHFGRSNWGGTRKLPRAFTEQGIAMLSSVLRSTRAVQVNIAIMRAFVRLRELMPTHKDLARKLESLEKKYDAQFKKSSTPSGRSWPLRSLRKKRSGPTRGNAKPDTMSRVESPEDPATGPR
jgi:hypothetical protein